jgi:organic radical activating enzyme
MSVNQDGLIGEAGELQGKKEPSDFKIKTDEFFNKYLAINTNGQTKPFIIQDFKSLEGEGGNNAVGVTTLFLRLNKCNLSCKFCDTSFSIKGDPKYNLVEANTAELTKYLDNKYSEDDKKYIHSCSITGGEPLIHLKEFKAIIKHLKASFVNIDHIIIETNGLMLYSKKECMKMLKLANELKGIKLTLSISPKLDAGVSYGKASREEGAQEMIYSIHKKLFKNFNKYLSHVVEVQVKFVHHETLEKDNTRLMNSIIKNNWITPRTKLLIMPFTPANWDKNEEGLKAWHKSKDDAAKFALDNYLRYSPRIHIDRKMD